MRFGVLGPLAVWNDDGRPVTVPGLKVRALLADELGLDPGSDLVALHQAILTQDPALDAPPAPPAPLVGTRPRPRTNLHAPATDLIGRDDAVAEIGSRLGTDRLVTLTGPGGVGKTRLAVETATRLVGTFPDGVWMVELAALERSAAPELVGALTDVVMRVLDIRDAPGHGAPGAPIDRLTDALCTRRLLLVLDNCEHVIEQVAELAELLRAVPGLRVLATSREPLALAGEVVWNVPPLDVPARTAETDPAVLARSSAVRLFVDRAAAAARGFRLDAETRRRSRCSAGGWTASRWHWSWPRRGCGRSAYTAWWPGSTTGSGCWPPGTGAPRTGSEP